jgi:hypothetical protein
MTKIVIVFCALIALVLGLPEKPAPYPAKGWKPQGARLELPRQYGTPRPDLDQIEFTTLTNEYLPPTTTEVQSDENDDALRVQGLPAVDSFSQFKQFQKRKQANVRASPKLGRIQMAPAPAFANQPLLLSPLFAPQFAPVSGQLQERRFGRLEQAAEVNDPKNDVQQLPARAYGPPQTNNDVPTPEKENDEPELPQNEEPEQPQNDIEDDEDQSDEDESDEPVIAVSNVESNGNLVQGQYYLLLPDQSLQKVRFATKQTDEDRQINGFSAQLR